MNNNMYAGNLGFNQQKPRRNRFIEIQRQNDQNNNQNNNNNTQPQQYGYAYQAQQVVSISSPQIPSTYILSTPITQQVAPYTFPQNSIPIPPPPTSQLPQQYLPQPPPQTSPQSLQFVATNAPITYNSPPHPQPPPQTQFQSPLQPQTQQYQSPPFQSQVIPQPPPPSQQQQPYQTQVLFSQTLPSQVQPMPFQSVPINSIPIPYAVSTMAFDPPFVANKRDVKRICNILNDFAEYIDRISEEKLKFLLEKRKNKKKMASVIKQIQYIFKKLKSQKLHKILKKFAKKYDENKRDIKKDIETDKDKYDDFDELVDLIKDLPSDFKWDEDSSDSSDNSDSDSDSDSDNNNNKKNKTTKHSSAPTSPRDSSVDIYNTPENSFKCLPSLKRSITSPPLPPSLTSSYSPLPPERKTTKYESKPIKSEEETEECAICIEPVPKSQIYSSPCKEHHRFCYECAKRGFNGDIKEKKLPTCAMQCGYQYSVEDVSKIFKDSMGLQFVLQSFSDLHDEVFLRDKMVECPREGCHGKGYLDNGDVTEEVECPKCGEYFCPRCQLLSHPSFECDSIRRFQQQWYEWNINGRDERRRQKGNVKRMTDEATRKDSQRKNEMANRLRELQNDEEYKKQHCRLCPRCRIPIEKIEGCRDMICGQDYHGGNGQPGCGHHFDYYNEGLDYVPTIENHMKNEDFFKNIPKIDNDTDHEYACSNCNKRIHGIRFGCLHVVGYYLCEDCEADENIRRDHHPHGDEHIFRIITSPDDI